MSKKSLHTTAVMLYMKLQDGKHEAVNEMLMRSLKILSYMWWPQVTVHCAQKSNVNITSKRMVLRFALKSHWNNINEVANQVEHVGLYYIIIMCFIRHTVQHYKAIHSIVKCQRLILFSWNKSLLWENLERPHKQVYEIATTTSSAITLLHKSCSHQKVMCILV